MHMTYVSSPPKLKKPTGLTSFPAQKVPLCRLGWPAWPPLSQNTRQEELAAMLGPDPNLVPKHMQSNGLLTISLLQSDISVPMCFCSIFFYQLAQPCFAKLAYSFTRVSDVQQLGCTSWMYGLLPVSCPFDLHQAQISTVGTNEVRNIQHLGPGGVGIGPSTSCPFGVPVVEGM